MYTMKDTFYYIAGSFALQVWGIIMNMMFLL